jgi:heme-degrading monooxygenase HmoA
VNPLARTPAPPYYAVIFSSVRSPLDEEPYGETADRMVELAATMPGFLGIESVRDPAGVGLTVSYWESEEAIRGWQRHAEHVVAQRLGREKWYERYELRVSRVERAYGFQREGSDGDSRAD